jgi:hypothetical protein
MGKEDLVYGRWRESALLGVQISHPTEERKACHDAGMHCGGVCAEGSRPKKDAGNGESSKGANWGEKKRKEEAGWRMASDHLSCAAECKVLRCPPAQTGEAAKTGITVGRKRGGETL